MLNMPTLKLSWARVFFHVRPVAGKSHRVLMAVAVISVSAARLNR